MKFHEQRRARWRRHTDPSAAGYILLEVMLALAIFGIAVMGLARALEHCSSSILSSNRESQILLALRSHLAELRTLPIELGTKTDTSDDPTVSLEHEWKPCRLLSTDKVQLNDLYELSVRAKWFQRGEPREQEASILLYRPQP